MEMVHVRRKEETMMPGFLACSMAAGSGRAVPLKSLLTMQKRTVARFAFSGGSQGCILWSMANMPNDVKEVFP